MKVDTAASFIVATWKGRHEQLNDWIHASHNGSIFEDSWTQ